MPGPRLIDLGNPVASCAGNESLIAWYLRLPNLLSAANLFDLRGPRFKGTLVNSPSVTPPIALAPDGFPWLSFTGTGDTGGTANYVDLGLLSGNVFTDSPGFAISGWIRPTTIDGGWHSVVIKGDDASNRQFFIGLNGGFSGVTDGLSLFTSSTGNGEFGTVNALTANRTYFFLASHLGSGAGGNQLFVWCKETGAWDSGQSGTQNPDSTGIDSDSGVNSVFVSRFNSSTTRAFPGQIGSLRFMARGGHTLRDAQRMLAESLAGYPRLLNRYTPRPWAFGGAGSGGGGTPFTGSYSGSCTPSGTLRLATSKSFAGSSTATGALTKAAAKPLAGSVTGAGALAKAVAKPLAGSTTASGACAKGVGKPLAGATTPTGSVAKAVGKTFGGSSTPTGALAVGRAILLAIGGAVTATGSLVKSVTKYFTGSSTPTGTLSTVGGSTITTAIGVIFRRVLWSLARIFRRGPSWLRKFQRPAWSLNRTWRYTPMPNAIPPQTLSKTVSDDRDFLFDLTSVPEIVQGATVSSATILGGTGLTIGPPAVLATTTDGIAANKGVSVEISGGSDDTDYNLACRAVLSTGRIVVIPARVSVAADYE